MRRMIVTPLALLFAAFLGGVAMAQSSEDIEAANKAAVEASFAAWHAGTGSPYDLLADDAVWTIVGRSLASKTYESREAFMTEVIGPFNARMSRSLQPTIRDIYADGDTVIVFFDAAGTALRQHLCLVPANDRRRGGQAIAFFDSIAFNDLWQRVSPQ